MGGSMAGEVSFPVHMTRLHQGFLYGAEVDEDFSAWGSFTGINITSLVTSAAATNVYASTNTNAVAYDPDADLAAAQLAINDFDGEVAAIDETVDIASYVASAVSQAASGAGLTTLQSAITNLSNAITALSAGTDIPAALASGASAYDTSLASETELGNVVDAFDLKSQARHARAVARATAGMWDIRAVQTSHFGMMLANMEADRAIEVDDFEAKLRMESAITKRSAAIELAKAYVAELQFKVQALQTVAASQAQLSDLQKQIVGALTQLQLQLRGMALNSMQNAAAAQMDLSIKSIVARQDELAYNLAMDEKEALWKLELHKYVNGSMASIAGSSGIPMPTKVERILNATANIFSMASGVAATVIGLASLF